MVSGSERPRLQSAGRNSAGAPAGQGRASGAAAKRRTLDGPHVSAGYNTGAERRAVDFARIKRDVTLSMVLSRYGVLDQLKRVGSQLSGCCPIHYGTNPKQFVVHLTSNNWHCFGDCNRGGGVIDLVALRERISPIQAAQLLADWFQIFASPEPQPPKQRSKSVNTRPSHRAYVIEDAEGDQTEQKGFWTKIGSAWPHKDGKGLNIQLIPGLAVSGRVVLREYTEDQEPERKASSRTTAKKG